MIRTIQDQFLFNRRAEEPMGLGRFHHPGLGTLQALGAGADLQLVELVCEAGKSQSEIRGDHQPAVSALGCGPSDHSRWRKAAHHYFAARRERQSKVVAHWYPCAHQPIQNRCGAAQNQIGLAAGLRAHSNYCGPLQVQISKPASLSNSGSGTCQLSFLGLTVVTIAMVRCFGAVTRPLLRSDASGDGQAVWTGKLLCGGLVLLRRTDEDGEGDGI